MKLLVATMVFMIGSAFSGSASAASCKYEIKNARGITIDTVIAGSRYMDQYEACNEAKRNCRQEVKHLQRISRRGRRGLYCEKSRFSPGRRSGDARTNPPRRGGNTRVDPPRRGGSDYVTRTCSYLFDRKKPSRKDKVFTSTLSGPRGSGVKANACGEAFKLCLAYDIFHKGKCLKL